MLVNLVLLNHGSEQRDAFKIRIIQKGFPIHLPLVKVRMFGVVNTGSIYHESVTGSGKRGGAVLVTRFLVVAQSSVVIQAVLKEVFRNAVQAREAPLLLCVNLSAKKSN